MFLSFYYFNILLSENNNQTIIDGKKSDNVVFISADDVHISNFTLCNSKDNSGSMYYAGIKIISDKSDKVIGVHILGGHATEIIGEAALGPWRG